MMGKAGEGLAIRTAGVRQAPAMAALHGARFPDRAWTATSIERMIDSRGSLAHLAERLGTSIGFCLARTADQECEAHSLAVVPDRRNRGIGRCLMEAALRAARDRGCRPAYIEVAEHNVAALALYAGSGFATVARRTGYYRESSGRRVDALVLMGKLRRD